MYFQAMYSDAATYLVVNKGSLDDLNSRMDRPLTELSFRPNILIDGPGPFDEVFLRLSSSVFCICQMIMSS